MCRSSSLAMRRKSSGWGSRPSQVGSTRQVPPAAAKLGHLAPLSVVVCRIHDEVVANAECVPAGQAGRPDLQGRVVSSGASNVSVPTTWPNPRTRGRASTSSRRRPGPRARERSSRAHRAMPRCSTRQRAEAESSRGACTASGIEPRRRARCPPALREPTRRRPPLPLRARRHPLPPTRTPVSSSTKTCGQITSQMQSP